VEHSERSYQSRLMRSQHKDFPTTYHLQPTTFQRPHVEILHTSVSGCHSTSRFGEEDNIDKNSPKINRIAMIAPAIIPKPPLSEELEGNLMANGYDGRHSTSPQSQ